MPGTISIREGAYGGWQNAIRYVAQAGIGHLEVEARPAAEMHDVAGAIRAAGLDIATLSGGVDLDSTDSVDAFARSVATCGEIGVGTFFVSVGGTQLPRCEHMARLRALGDAAAGANVVLAMETHPPFCRNADGMLQTMEETDHPHIRLNLDTANIYYYNHGLNSAAELERVLDYVASLHLKDTDGGYESPNFPVLGEGVVDFPRIARALAGVGFCGPLTLELEGPVLAGLDLDGCHDVVRRCTSYLRTVGLP